VNKILFTFFLLIYLLLFSVHGHSIGFAEDKYCHPFDKDKCKAGDLIITGGMGVLQYCDLEKNIVTMNSGPARICLYRGNERSNRIEKPKQQKNKPGRTLEELYNLE
jgi:hypothetical protein